MAVILRKGLDNNVDLPSRLAFLSQHEVLWVSGQRDEARRIWREGRSKDSSNDVLRETLARLRVGRPRLPRLGVGAADIDGVDGAPISRDAQQLPGRADAVALQRGDR